MKPQEGAKVLALSSGTARQPNDPGYDSPGGHDKMYTTGSPPGYPKESPSCPGVTTGEPHDSAGLRVVIKTPTNAKSLSFNLDFYTYEFPNYICSQFNDFFVAMLTPKPGNQPDGNISYDSKGNTISVNAGFLQGGGFSHAIVDVEVDPETGKVTILRYTCIQDAGTAIHPSYVEGQMQGGAVQGIGWALNEEYYYDDSGRMVNSSYLDYRIPTTLDVPMIDTIIVEVPNPLHPYGVRGVGEPGIVPPLAAIANAVAHATGVRQTQLPMNPRRILETTSGK